MPNPSCPAGYRWDTSTNRCVPISGTVDPIKPPLPANKKTTSKKK